MFIEKVLDYTRSQGKTEFLDVLKSKRNLIQAHPVQSLITDNQLVLVKIIHRFLGCMH